MFHRLATGCIVFRVILKTIRIKCINRHNFIIFIKRAECVLCKIENMCQSYRLKHIVEYIFNRMVRLMFKNQS